MSMSLEGLLRFDALSVFIAGFVCLFSVLSIVYSIGFMKGRRTGILYYVLLILTALASLGVVLSNNLVLVMIFWGFLGLLLYLLIGYGKSERTAFTAKKTFIIIGGTDAFMLLGLALVWHLAGSVSIDQLSIPLDSKAAAIAYLSLMIGAFAKAGAMPVHTWVPDTAEDAPVPVTAFLPASLDKLLGIYFLTRLSLDIFQMNAAMNTVLLVTGSITIIVAVMMALVQHDLKRLLGYHAVSQVGYMVLGIGTGNPVGIAGGLFHMLNNAIYKSALFMSGGAVERRTGTSNLDKLGGYAKTMPITFATFLIASLAISGVPPFNGFASKWMVYQGIIETAATGSRLWVVWLVAAMLGSALTMASFMKLIHAIFLGQPSREAQVFQDRGETSPVMWLPMAVLAVLCVVFGVFAYRIPLQMWIIPSLSMDVTFAGMWGSGTATVLLIVGALAGLIIYFLGTIRKVRVTKIFVGGEEVDKNPDMRLSGTEFYNTISDIGLLKGIYRMAERKVFDVYEVGTKITFGISGILRFIHNGVLPSYLAWCLLGMTVLFIIMVLR